MDHVIVDDNNKELRNPWLSIIIPIYNAERFLRKCLDSILEQSFTDFELLLVDDGSTDSSSDICLEYSSKDNRIRYFKKKNGGPYQTRIFGTEQSCGTYITFCDADDFYATKDAFAILYNATKEEMYSVIQFGYWKKYNHLKRKGVSVAHTIDVGKNDFTIYEYPKLLCSFWENSHLTTSVCNKIYHRKLLSNLPDSNSSEKVFWGDDLILNLGLLENCDSMRLIPDYLYNYRQLSGGTNSFSKHTMEDLDNIKQYQLFFLNRYQGNDKEKIQNILFSEIAGWFFIYIQQALGYISDKELIQLISDTLCLPNFILARQYYLEHSKENWEAVNLLRKADSNEYLNKAKIYERKQHVKNSLRQILKRIYSML